VVVVVVHWTGGEKENGGRVLGKFLFQSLLLHLLLLLVLIIQIDLLTGVKAGRRFVSSSAALRLNWKTLSEGRSIHGRAGGMGWEMKVEAPWRQGTIMCKYFPLPSWSHARRLGELFEVNKEKRREKVKSIK